MLNKFFSEHYAVKEAFIAASLWRIVDVPKCAVPFLNLLYVK